MSWSWEVAGCVLQGWGNLGEGLCGLVQEVYLGMDGLVMGRTGWTGGGGGALFGGDGEGGEKEALTKAMPLLV